jgi:DNA polymerase-3 subunit beta
MKCTVNQDHLADAVAWTAKSLPSRPTIPVLAGVLLRAQNGQLHVSGFDYDVSNQATVDAHTDTDGAALVSGRLLAEITKALPAKPVNLAAVGAHLELVCGSARFTLPTMPVEDYPTLPKMPAAAGTVDAATFATATHQVAIAAGRDEALPIMTGIRVEATGSTLAMFATDRYRLAMRELPWQPKHPNTDLKALVPARVLTDAAKALGPGGDVTIAFDDDHIGGSMLGLDAGSRRTTSRLLDGENYPPVRTLFGGEHNATAVVNVATLTGVVRRIAVVAGKGAPVRLAFNDTGLVVEAGGTEDARASEAMEATFTGEPLTIAFNPQYLADGLSVLGTQKAVLLFQGPYKPAQLCPASEDGEVVPDYRYLIMPIRAVGAAA